MIYNECEIKVILTLKKQDVKGCAAKKHEIKYLNIICFK